MTEKIRSGEMVPLIDRTCINGHVIRASSAATVCRECGAGLKLICPACGDLYPRTYREHSGSAKHRAAIVEAVGRLP